MGLPRIPVVLFCIAAPTVQMLAKPPASQPAITVHPASNTDPQAGAVGEQAYEMAGRVAEPPTVAFDDVSGWEVEGRNARGWLYRSSEQRVAGEFSGKLVYVGTGPDPVLIVRPTEPIVLSELWDTVTYWNFGNSWGWSPQPGSPWVHIAVVLRDAGGEEFSLPAQVIDHAYWFMMCSRLSAEQRERYKRPISFAGFRITGGTNTENRTLYLGPCRFFQEQLSPLSFEPWPEKLPFPNRPETILPTNKLEPYHNEVRREQDATVFSYQALDANIEYRYQPTDGTLGDIAVLWNGRRVQPCAGGGFQFAGPSGAIAPLDPVIQRKLIRNELSDGRLRVSWHLQAGGLESEVTYELRILQKSLVVDIAACEPVFDRLVLGQTRPVSKPKLFKVPYLTYGWGNVDPRILYSDGMFLFTQLDWYVTDASRWWGANESGDDWAMGNGGAEYGPKTDGKRNPIRERLFINFSPDVQEVLPNIPNPASPYREMQRHRLWRVRMGDNHAAEIANAQQLRKYGCEHVTIRYHEGSWRDGGESFTFRTQAAPGRGGDEALQKFVRSIRDLGWWVGLYTNYIDFAPVNSYWDPDHVIRLSNGDWQRSWMRCYSAKPMWAVQMERELAPQIHEKFGTNHSYCDVHTVFMPSERVDYDARVPGAGTMRRTYECYGQILLNEKNAYQGPVYSEGRNHWIYAGLVDGNYAQLATDGDPSTEPLFVDFDLLKIHPLEMDAGMGSPGMFFKNAPPNLDQYIATTLAYGHIGLLDWSDTAGVLKIYYMLQALQPDYVMEPVARIEYEHQGQMLNTSAALACDAYLRNRVHVVYENGTEIYVNGSPEPWRVIVPEHEYELPQWGYVIDNGRGECAFSASSLGSIAYERPKQRLGRQRIDMMWSTSYVYFDTRGDYVPLEAFGFEGSAVLRKEGEHWCLIPTDRFSEFAMSAFPAQSTSEDYIWSVLQPNAKVIAFDRQGAELPPVETRWSRDMFHVLAGQLQAVRYELHPSQAVRPQQLDCEQFKVLAGQELKAKLPAGAKLDDSRPPYWERHGTKIPLEPRLEQDVLHCRIPEQFHAGQHFWLAVPTVQDGVLWLDFIIDEPPMIEPES